MDKKNLCISSEKLKRTVEDNLLKKKVAIVCMGPGDLQRCSDPGDFFRWEIDRARQLEGEGQLRVVVVVHGTADFEDLICGTVSTKKARERVVESLGEWGEDLLDYLRSHYVIFFDIKSLDPMVQKIIELYSRGDHFLETAKSRAEEYIRRSKRRKA
jgi:hypothetical protein